MMRETYFGVYDANGERRRGLGIGWKEAQTLEGHQVVGPTVNEARFVVDGRVLHVATEEMARMVLPQNILLTIWASDAAAWAGAVDGTTSPTSAQYDWIRVYRYVAPLARLRAGSK